MTSSDERSELASSSGLRYNRISMILARLGQGGIWSRYMFRDTRGVAGPRSGVCSPGAAPSHAYLRNSKRRQARLRVHRYYAALPPTRPTYSLGQNSLIVDVHVRSMDVGPTSGVIRFKEFHAPSPAATSPPCFISSAPLRVSRDRQVFKIRDTFEHWRYLSETLGVILKSRKAL